MGNQIFLRTSPEGILFCLYRVLTHEPFAMVYDGTHVHIERAALVYRLRHGSQAKGVRVASPDPTKTAVGWKAFIFLVVVGVVIWMFEVVAEHPLKALISTIGVLSPGSDPPPEPPAPSNPTAQTTPPTQEPTQTPSVPDVEPSAEPAPSVPSERVPSPIPALDDFRISVISKDYGDEIGPGQFQLSDQHGKVRVIYTWEAVMSDGTGNDSEGCQILASVSGPQQVDSMRTNKCTFQRVSTIAARADNVQDYTQPGEYTITVKDELSGATGTTSFMVR